MGKEPDKYTGTSSKCVVPNGFQVASARRDERISRESRPGDETIVATSTKYNTVHKPRGTICFLNAPLAEFAVPMYRNQTSFSDS